MGVDGGSRVVAAWLIRKTKKEDRMALVCKVPKWSSVQEGLRTRRGTHEERADRTGYEICVCV